MTPFFVAPLDRAERRFRLWAQGEGNFAKAASLIPSDWSDWRKKLWEARLAAIRDNEHIRRIEQPVYERRWDEQWKVGNQWRCCAVAYAAVTKSTHFLTLPTTDAESLTQR